jgi:hypothetical protein
MFAVARRAREGNASAARRPSPFRTAIVADEAFQENFAGSSNFGKSYSWPLSNTVLQYAAEELGPMPNERREGDFPQNGRLHQTTPHGR